MNEFLANKVKPSVHDFTCAQAKVTVGVGVEILSDNGWSVTQKDVSAAGR